MSHPWPTLLPVVRDVFRPPPSDPIWVWAEENLRITPSMNADFAGQPWSIDRVPHTRLIFDFFSDPTARELHIMKSSAAAFSTAIVVGICWFLRFKPLRVIYCLNSMVEMRKLSKTYFQPFLRQVFGLSVIDSPDQSTLFIEFPNGSILEMGSPTEGLFSGKQAQVVILDEYDLYPDQLEGGVTGPLAAARGRFKGSTRFAKLITLTAPQKKYDPARKDHYQPGTKQHRAYLGGDMREYRIPCPHCKIPFAPEMAHLHFEHLRQPPPAQLEIALDQSTGEPPPPPFDMQRVRAEAALQCPACFGHIAEGTGPADKAAVVRRGVWVPTHFENPPSRWSARHTDLCALIGDSTLGTLAAEVIDARGRSRHDLVNVMRARFGEPESDEDAVDLTSAHVRRHCGAYERGNCPVVPWFIALVVDCQKGPSEALPLLFKWGRLAFAENGTVHVIDYGQTTSNHELRAVYEAPVPYCGPPLKSADPDVPAPAKVNFYCQRAVIDSGYRAGADQVAEENFEHHIYPLCIGWSWRPGGQWIRKQDGWEYTGSWHLLPFKGRSREQMQGEFMRGSTVTIPHPSIGPVHLPLHLFNDPAFKGQLYHNMLAADPGNPTDPRLRQYPRIFLPAPMDDMDETFLSEITAERLMDRIKKVRGQSRLTREWATPPKRKNDYGDVLKMGLVLWSLMSRAALADTAPAPLS